MHQVSAKADNKRQQKPNNTHPSLTMPVHNNILLHTLNNKKNLNKNNIICC